MIKAIIFDYDGVIVDSFSEVHKIYQKMCKELGKECPVDLEEFKKIYGQNSSECHKQLGFNDEEIEEGNKIYKREVSNIRPALFEGIKEVLQELSKKYKLSIVSSSYRDDIELKLDGFGIRKYFLDILGRESITVKRFEKTDAIKNLLKKYNLSNNQVLLIGDRNVDFVEGSKAGLEKILLVDYGWGYDLKLIPSYKPKVSIKSPRDLINAVEKF